MSNYLEEDEYREWLSDLLRREADKYGSIRKLSDALGVSHVQVSAWILKEQLPNEQSTMRLAAHFGLTGTPFYEAKRSGEARRQVKEDRLRKILGQLPEDQQDEFLDEWEDRVAAWLRRRGASQP